MKLSTKGRYAVMAMVDLALHASENKPATISDISDRQGLSGPYLEQLLMKLRRKGLAQSARGQAGGYFLPCSPTQIAIFDIFTAVDETLEMTRCNPESPKNCQGQTHDKCLTHHLWAGLHRQVILYLKGIRLSDVCHRRVPTLPTEFKVP